MNLAEYIVIVEGWRKKYGVSILAFKYDPTKVKTSCAKCKQWKPKMARHHKANDFFFAYNFPNLYARRYILFHPDDCDKLCDKCHEQCHKYFASLAAEMYLEFEGEKGIAHDEGWWMEWCEKWKSRFLELYNKWISKPPYKRKRRRKHGNAKRGTQGVHRKGN